MGAEGWVSTYYVEENIRAGTKGFLIVFVMEPRDVPLIISGVNEVKVHDARTITFSKEDARLCTNGIDLAVIPKSDTQIRLGSLPMQLLLYHMSVLRGIDPDSPRNLSKMLTVD